MQAKVCLCLPRLESLSPQSSGRPIIKSHWPSSSDSLGIPSPFVDSQAEKPGVGFRTFTIVRELLWYHCSPVCGFTHPGGVRFDFTVNAPLLPPHCGFYFVFGHEVSVFHQFQHHPVDDYSTASCDFGALAGEDECMSFYSTRQILNHWITKEAP